MTGIPLYRTLTYYVYYVFTLQVLVRNDTAATVDGSSSSNSTSASSRLLSHGRPSSTPGVPGSVPEASSDEDEDGGDPFANSYGPVMKIPRCDATDLDSSSLGIDDDVCFFAAALRSPCAPRARAWATPSDPRTTRSIRKTTMGKGAEGGRRSNSKSLRHWHLCKYDKI